MVEKDADEMTARLSASMVLGRTDRPPDELAGARLMSLRSACKIDSSRFKSSISSLSSSSTFSAFPLWVSISLSCFANRSCIGPIESVTGSTGLTGSGYAFRRGGAAVGAVRLQAGHPWSEGTANFGVRTGWNKAEVYHLTIAWFASQLAGR